MNIIHKLAEDAIGTILAGSDDWIDDDKSHDFEGDYDWVNDDTCMLYFRVDGKYIGSWDVDIAEIEDIMVLDDISSEVEAAVSGMERSEYNESLSKLNESNHTMKENINESEFDFDNDFILDIVKMGYETGHQIFDSYEDFIEDEEVQDIDDIEAAWDFYCELIDMGPADFYEEYKDELDFSEDFISKYGNDVINENWQDDWVEPTIDPNPIDNVNGLDIYKGTDQYGEEAYYLFLEDEDPEPGYEEWQTETLKLAREWASSYETVEADDFDDLYEYLTPGNIIRESYSKGIPSEILDMIKDSKRVRNAFIEIGLDPSKMIIDKVDKFHRNNPNYLPVEVYEYNLDDKYSDRSIYGGVGIKIGGYKDIYDSMPGAYIKKTKTIGIYEIDITKNIENNAIIGDKIELRATNKNDPKNQYLDRVSDRDPTIDKTIDKSGYYTVGNFKSKYGKKELTRRHDIMKGESVEADDFDDEIGPNAYKYIFKALDKRYWDNFDWSDVEYYDGKLCRVTDTSVVGHDFKSCYHDIEFEDGTELSSISGIHLQPVKKGRNPYFTESFDRKVEGATKRFLKKGSIIHNAGETLEVIDQNSDDTLLVGLNNDGDRKNRYIVAWGLQSDGSWNQGHYFFDEKEARKSFDKRAKIRTESNSVSRNLPYVIDNFLQDVAQIAGTITYSDIVNFKYMEKDKAPLNKLKRAWYDALDDDADDEILQDIGSRVANYIKNKLKSKLRREC